MRDRRRLIRRVDFRQQELADGMFQSGFLSAIIGEPIGQGWLPVGEDLRWLLCFPR